ncbi:methyltransferase [Hahella aquimaris]|uniref:methyltransferase family protein n=1 Tax=Hahella sp. HNIBRBA332 TaxID=3015983 RepID=UPI00273AA112|nr:methyltransferase [Hahella sp. HNIBRBA332]WLQ16225.1 methyltransferase [Hahella sp. HNIBRBA332]
MTSLIVFKILCWLILSVFFYYGYDMRRRPNWRELAPSISTRVMKSAALALGVILVTAIACLSQLKATDYAAFLCFLIGALLVCQAKTELEKNHAFTWTGYVLCKPHLVTSGIYAWLRHPLYAGVYLVEIGGALVVLPHASEWFPHAHFAVSLGLSLALLYAMFFNLLQATRESRFLSQVFGEEYLRYASRVRAFLPISKGR